MGNPHPTKSKPIKIGRKHTGARSEKWKQRARNATLHRSKIRRAVIKRYKVQVARFWRGELDTHPTIPSFVSQGRSVKVQPATFLDDEPAEWRTPQSSG